MAPACNLSEPLLRWTCDSRLTMFGSQVQTFTLSFCRANKDESLKVFASTFRAFAFNFSSCFRQSRTRFG
jgi:hypothetical protein